MLTLSDYMELFLVGLGFGCTVFLCLPGLMSWVIRLRGGKKKTLFANLSAQQRDEKMRNAWWLMPAIGVWVCGFEFIKAMIGTSTFPNAAGVVTLYAGASIGSELTRRI